MHFLFYSEVSSSPSWSCSTPHLKHLSDCSQLPGCPNCSSSILARFNHSKPSQARSVWIIYLECSCFKSCLGWFATLCLLGCDSFLLMRKKSLTAMVWPLSPVGMKGWNQQGWSKAHQLFPLFLNCVGRRNISTTAGHCMQIHVSSFELQAACVLNPVGEVHLAPSSSSALPLKFNNSEVVTDGGDQWRQTTGFPWFPWCSGAQIRRHSGQSTWLTEISSVVFAAVSHDVNSWSSIVGVTWKRLQWPSPCTWAGRRQLDDDVMMMMSWSHQRSIVTRAGQIFLPSTGLKVQQGSMFLVVHMAETTSAKKGWRGKRSSLVN